MTTMTKRSEDIQKSIVEMVAKSNPTKTALCKKFSITWQTLKNWRETDAAFDAAYKEAERHYLSELAVEAKKSLKKIVKGFDTETEKTVYLPGKDGDPVIAQKVVTRTHVPPNEKAIEFVLRNIDLENFE